MFSVYTIKLSNGKYYIGQTNNLEKRLERHQSGQCKYTKPFRPLKLVYAEEYPTRSEAVLREQYLKSLKNHKALLRTITLNGDEASSSNG